MFLPSFLPVPYGIWNQKHVVQLTLRITNERGARAIDVGEGEGREGGVLGITCIGNAIVGDDVRVGEVMSEFMMMMSELVK